MRNVEVNCIKDCASLSKLQKEIYAARFSEGSSSLEQLLLLMWEKGINTYACCVGHEESKTKNGAFNIYFKNEPYLYFDITNIRSDLLTKLLSKMFYLYGKELKLCAENRFMPYKEKDCLNRKAIKIILPKSEEPFNEVLAIFRQVLTCKDFDSFKKFSMSTFVNKTFYQKLKAIDFEDLSQEDKLFTSDIVKMFDMDLHDQLLKTEHHTLFNLIGELLLESNDGNRIINLETCESINSVTFLCKSENGCGELKRVSPNTYALLSNSDKKYAILYEDGIVMEADEHESLKKGLIEDSDIGNISLEYTHERFKSIRSLLSLYEHNEDEQIFERNF